MAKLIRKDRMNISRKARHALGKLSEKHAYALIGLCEICFAQGMIKAMGDMAG